MKKNKSKWFIILLLALVLFFILLFFIFNFQSSEVVLKSYGGQVEVYRNGQKISVNSEMKLKKDDLIKTHEKSSATILLYDTAIIQVGESTEITLKELIKRDIKIKQNRGSTWNKFLALAGTDSYSVETPTTVAVVRGTSFFINASEDVSDIFVGDGVVELKDESATKQIKQFERLIKEKGKEAVLSELTTEQKALLINFIYQDIKLMRQIREDKIKNNLFVMNFLKYKYQINEENLPTYLKRIDKGDINLSLIKEKSPIKGQFLDSLEKISNEIIAHKKLLDELLETTKTDSALAQLINPEISLELEKEKEELSNLRI